MQRLQHIDDIHRRIFAAMLANLDDSVGAVLDKLQTEQLEEKTTPVLPQRQRWPDARIDLQ